MSKCNNSEKEVFVDSDKANAALKLIAFLEKGELDGNENGWLTLTDVENF